MISIEATDFHLYDQHIFTENWFDPWYWLIFFVNLIMPFTFNSLIHTNLKKPVQTRKIQMHSRSNSWKTFQLNIFQTSQIFFTVWLCHVSTDLCLSYLTVCSKTSLNKSIVLPHESQSLLNCKHSSYLMKNRLLIALH